MQMIIRKELIELIYKDLQEKKIIYLSAPCGWGKTVLLQQIADFLRSGREECMFLNTQEEVGQGLVPATHPKDETEKEAHIFLVDNLEEWLMSGRMEALMNHIHIGRKENKFILGGRIPLPAQLVPYKICSQISIYGRDKLKYSREELDQMCDGLSRGNSREQLRSMYEVCGGMPLLLAVAGDLLEEEAYA